MKNSANEEQKQVIESHEKNIVCLAGAGTGKTFTLISRIFYLIDDLNIDPASILNLTFTNAAASEMKTRYLFNSSSVREPFFGTFHAFCYHLLTIDKQILHKLKYKQVPKIIDEFEATRYYEMAKQLSRTNLPKRAYRRSYKPRRREEFQFKVFHKELNRILRKENKITFDNLCYDICDLFIQNDFCIQKYKKLYKYIQVDEFQDTDELQWMFVQSFQGSSNIFVCGDINQCIYQFRGTTNEILKALTHAKDWKVYKLERNYRSTIEICNFSNNIEYTKDIGVKMCSDKHGEEVKIESTEKFNKSLLRFENVKDKSVAILCRTNKEVSKIQNELDQYEIEYNHIQVDSDFNLLLCALDRRYYREYLLNQCDEKDRANYIQQELFFDSDILIPLKKKFKDIDKKVDEIQDSDNFGDMRLLYEIGELHRKLDSPKMLLEEGLYVGTIHSVKGLEFDEVYVYNVNEKTFKIKDEESKNILYVACTRPKELLTVITNSDISLL